MTCENCGKQIPDGHVVWQLAHGDVSGLTSLCSIDCVIEYAWKIREAQPKLSKSNTGA